MAAYPISLPRVRVPRNASELKKLEVQMANDTVAAIEQFINKRMQEQTTRAKQYSYADIALALKIPVETVRAFYIDCGHNGFTGIRLDLPEK